MEFFITIIELALVSAFIICLLGKLKVIEHMQVHGNDLIHELASCNFCLSWWTNVIVCAVAFAIFRETSFLYMPFFSTMVTRYLL